MAFQLAITITESFRRNLLLNISESDDEDNDNNLVEMITMEGNMRLRRTRRKPPRIEGYVEQIVSSFNTREFRSHFRIEPTTVEDMESRISPLIVRQADEGRPAIEPRRQILCVLWLLATPDSYRSIGQQFGMGKSSLHHCFRRVVKALNMVSGDVIRWPQHYEINIIKTKFHEIAGLPDVVGAIDGCHIEIDAPKNDAAAYKTGKKRYAMQLQAVCTPDLHFTDCFAGYPGSVHDARVFKNSPIFRDANEIFQGNEYILGDKAYYPVRLWCIPPYKNLGNMTQEEINFNKRHSQSRQVIERAFGLLKGRFRRLKHLCVNNIKDMAITILAACVLHNLCLRGYETEDIIDQYIQDGLQENIGNNGDRGNEQDNGQENEAENQAALSKRNNLRDLVARLINVEQ